jgi:hypothetical protein
VAPGGPPLRLVTAARLRSAAELTHALGASHRAWRMGALGTRATGGAAKSADPTGRIAHRAPICTGGHTDDGGRERHCGGLYTVGTHKERGWTESRS